MGIEKFPSRGCDYHPCCGTLDRSKTSAVSWEQGRELICFSFQSQRPELVLCILDVYLVKVKGAQGLLVELIAGLSSVCFELLT